MKQLSKRRLAENQVIFRRANESVLKGVTGDAIEFLDGTNDVLFEFYCECSDDKCRDHLSLLGSIYGKIHNDRAAFCITCGHEIDEVEEVTERNAAYCVVQKYKTPPESATVLHPVN